MIKIILIIYTLFISFFVYSRDYFGISYFRGAKESELLSVNGDVPVPSFPISGFAIEYLSQGLLADNLALGIKVLNSQGDKQIYNASSVRPGNYLTKISTQASLIGPVAEFSLPFGMLRVGAGAWPIYGIYSKAFAYDDGLYSYKDAKFFMLGQILSIGLDFQYILLSIKFTQFSSISSSSEDVQKESPNILEFQLSVSLDGKSIR